jgi:23S rRNA pseudouridine1911/1915/1917 synthase
MPVLGETKYARGAPFAEGLALHARSLELDHPVRHEPLRIEAPLPASWSNLAGD